MKISSQLQQKLLLLPDRLRQIVAHPSQKQINFEGLSPQNAQELSNSVRTKTLLSLLDPPLVCQNQQTSKAVPLILVFCQPSEQISILPNEIYPFAPVSYSSWLESAGATCLPLPYNLNEGSMQFLLERCHGLLIPGGCSNLYRSYQNKEGYGPVTVGFLKIWRLILKIWSKGIYFPVWGTCLGLEIVLIALSNDIKILSNLNSKNHQVQIFSDYENSQIFSEMPAHLRLLLQNKRLLNFAHMHGLSVQKLNGSQKLRQKLKLISVSKDKDGKWFCSFLEGRDNPLFLSQFHPQKQGFQWSMKGDIIHSKQSVMISQFLASKFVEQCRKCKPLKDFQGKSEQIFYEISQFQQIFTPQKLYKVYAIDFRFREYDRNKKKKTLGPRKSLSLCKKIEI